jgi:cytochrome c oxidase subunit 3
MTTATDAHVEHHEDDSIEHYRYKTTNFRWGLWLFIISDTFLFLGLLIARFNLMGDTRPELDQTLGLIVTGMLLVSSFLINRAEIAIAAGDIKAFKRNTLGTIILGVLFTIGVVGVEWPLAAQHVAVNTVAGSIFFTMTGMHALHVVTGVIFLVIVYNNGRKGLYTQERHWPVEAAAVYWHFIDVVWIFFYPALYLIGSKVVGG